MVLIITSMRNFIQIKRMTSYYNLKNSGRMLLIAGLLILSHITWSSARQHNCDERGPVCGNDGRTYQTMCQLIWARLEDSDLQVLHEGSCNGQSQSLSGFIESSEAEGEGDTEYNSYYYNTYNLARM